MDVEDSMVGIVVATIILIIIILATEHVHLLCLTLC